MVRRTSWEMVSNITEKEDNQAYFLFIFTTCFMLSYLARNPTSNGKKVGENTKITVVVVSM